MSSDSYAVIRPEVVANKLAAIRNHEYPELYREIRENPEYLEMLWFLQAMSMEPGGLVKFAKDLITQFPDHIGTKTMLQIGKPSQGRYKAEEAVLILAEIKRHTRRSTWLSHVLEPSDFKEIEKGESEFAKENQAALEYMEHSFLYRTCMETAEAELPWILAQYCDNPAWSLSGGQCRNAWFISDATNLVLRMMHLWENRVSDQVAKTEVTAKIFEGLDYAKSESIPALIEGNPRVGKTESLEKWCRKRPGIARLVTVPSSNTMSDFLKAIARALGIETSINPNAQALRERIEFVLAESRICLVFDEAAFLLPQKFSRNTTPARINWLRTVIIDKKLPCGMAVTPQFRRDSLHYQKTSGYTLEQFLGRIAHHVPLPGTLSRDDLLKVAKIHFPELNGRILSLIVDEVVLSKSYLKALEDISRRARYLSKERGASIGLKDIDQAINEMVDARKAPNENPVRRAAAVPAQTYREDLAENENRQSPIEMETNE
jgi:hypothetical protein